MVAQRPFDEIVEFITSAPKPEDIIAFHPSAASQARVSFLLSKNSESDLTAEEKRELEQYLMIEHLMRLAKTRARKRLAA